MILALRTDKPEAEIYLCNQTAVVRQLIWLAHRELSDTLLLKIDELLALEKLRLQQLSGLVIFQGPGSFTGLRIGISVANSLAYSLQLPIVGSMGEGWLDTGLKQLTMQAEPQVIVPFYGSEVTITQPRK